MCEVIAEQLVEADTDRRVQGQQNDLAQNGCPFLTRNRTLISDFGKFLAVICVLIEGGGSAWQYYSEGDLRKFEQEQNAWKVINEFGRLGAGHAGNIGQKHAIELLAAGKAPMNGINLDGAELGELDVRGAKLSHAIFSNSNLTNANFDGADLRHADLSNAMLQGATFRWGASHRYQVKQSYSDLGRFQGGNI